ncbi:AhpC/TSA family protein [Hymenobacter sp. BRD128]|uniref:TlpA disulfide reductase family protein n=1 Tax=Hymenobacter sp. BRD128 TaxID=2675878 RepID=UPI001562EE3C|nr:TlpA disulfide reductase family protein [Hymenobacter sp. BRD128]QKG57886.1 AhpC/TSA family protein [Hymenobacter sp. BRD128]
MKTLLPLALAALLASPACAQIQLIGDITGMGTRTAEYHYTRQGKDYTDTLRVVNGHFAQAIPATDDGMGNIIFRNAGGSFESQWFWVEPGTVHVRGTAHQLNRLDATGTPENNVLSAYNHTVGWKDYGKSLKPTADDQPQQAQAARQFIKAHLAARTSAYQLYQQTKMQLNYPGAEYERLLQCLTPAVRQSWYGQRAAERVAILRNQPTLGKAVTTFSMADTAGVQHSLATYRGKYVLLDFWGHWCHPCLEAMPKVKTLHQQYADKLTIIGVALEGPNSAPLWKKAIRQHQVPGLQLSELQGTDGPVIIGYNINSFPTYLLLDPQGKLVARTSDVDEITQKLATLGRL